MKCYLMHAGRTQLDFKAALGGLPKTRHVHKHEVPNNDYRKHHSTHTHRHLTPGALSPRPFPISAVPAVPVRTPAHVAAYGGSPERAYKFGISSRMMDRFAASRVLRRLCKRLTHL